MGFQITGAMKAQRKRHAMVNRVIRRLVVHAVCLIGLWPGFGAWAQSPDTVTYVYTDPQGTPLAEADAQGNVIARYDYAPYGTPVASLGNPPNGPGYTGHVNDPDTGLVYMQARYYDPAVGRFLNTDPEQPEAGDITSINRYVYASNNPVINIDPDGRQDCVASGCSVGPIPPSFFRDSAVGRFVAHSVGDPIAVFTADNVNPINGDALSPGQVQDAKLSILMLAAPAPTKMEGAIADALKPMARGVASEAKVLAEMGLTKNTEAVSSAEGRSIPDALTNTMSVEVKDTARVTATRQVRIQTDAASASGRQSVLVTGQNTRVSKAAAARYDRIIRRPDLGPKR